MEITGMMKTLVRALGLLGAIGKSSAINDLDEAIVPSDDQIFKITNTSTPYKVFWRAGGSTFDKICLIDNENDDSNSYLIAGTRQALVSGDQYLINTIETPHINKGIRAEVSQMKCVDPNGQWKPRVELSLHHFDHRSNADNEHNIVLSNHYLDLNTPMSQAASLTIRAFLDSRCTWGATEHVILNPEENQHTEDRKVQLVKMISDRFYKSQKITPASTKSYCISETVPSKVFIKLVAESKSQGSKLYQEWCVAVKLMSERYTCYNKTDERWSVNVDFKPDASSSYYSPPSPTVMSESDLAIPFNLGNTKGQKLNEISSKQISL